MYNLSDFASLRTHLRDVLFNASGEPISCGLFDIPEPRGAWKEYLEVDDLEIIHVAEACNIAGVIASIERILSSPRSNIACEELSEVLLLRIDVLREYIRSTSDAWPSVNYIETEADKSIRRWAGFLKHPGKFVFAHRCMASWGVEFDEPIIVVDDQFLSTWDRLDNQARDRKKTELADKIVTVNLPTVPMLQAVLDSCCLHLNRLLKA